MARRTTRRKRPANHRAKRRKTWILQLDRDDPEADAKELDFDVRFRLSLSRAECFRRMWTHSQMIAKMLISHGHKKNPGIFQRT